MNDVFSSGSKYMCLFIQREKWLLNVIEKSKELRVEIPLEGLGKETFIFPIDKFDRKRIKR